MSACECSRTGRVACGQELGADSVAVEFIPSNARTPGDPMYRWPHAGSLRLLVNSPCAIEIVVDNKEWARVLPHWYARWLKGVSK